MIQDWPVLGTRQSCEYILVFPAESLVHLQRDHDSGERHTGRVQPGAAVWGGGCGPGSDGVELGGSGGVLWVPPTLLLAWSNLPAPSSCSLVRLVSRCFLEESMRRDLSCKFSLLNPDQLWEETELPLDILMT